MAVPGIRVNSGHLISRSVLMVALHLPEESVRRVVHMM